jgi:hypothetical protein
VYSILFEQATCYSTAQLAQRSYFGSKLQERELMLLQYWQELIDGLTKIRNPELKTAGEGWGGGRGRGWGGGRGEEAATLSESELSLPESPKTFHAKSAKGPLVHRVTDGADDTRPFVAVKTASGGSGKSVTPVTQEGCASEDEDDFFEVKKQRVCLPVSTLQKESLRLFPAIPGNHVTGVITEVEKPAPSATLSKSPIIRASGKCPVIQVHVDTGKLE